MQLYRLHELLSVIHSFQKRNQTCRGNKLILKAQNPVSLLKLKDSETPEITYKDFLPQKVTAPVQKDQLIGTREYFINGKSIGVLNLVAEKSYKLDPITFLVNKMIAFVTSPWLFVGIALFIAIVILLERRRRRILRKKRRDAQRKRNRELIRKIDE